MFTPYDTFVRMYPGSAHTKKMPQAFISGCVSLCVGEVIQKFSNENKKVANNNMVRPATPYCKK